MLDNYIEKLKPYVIDLFKNDSSGHDFYHTLRVYNKCYELIEYLKTKELK